MNFKLIPNWITRNLKCHFCGADKSVKYEVTVGGKNVSVCNRCVLTHSKDID